MIGGRLRYAVALYMAAAALSVSAALMIAGCASEKLGEGARIDPPRGCIEQRKRAPDAIC